MAPHYHNRSNGVLRYPSNKHTQWIFKMTKGAGQMERPFGYMVHLGCHASCWLFQTKFHNMHELLLCFWDWIFSTVSV